MGRKRFQWNWNSGRLNAPPTLQLTTEQITATNAIQAEIDTFNTWLLHGATGSGKTEIYLQVTSMLLKQGRQVLILVPEINLTPQLEAIFRSTLPRYASGQPTQQTQSFRAHKWLATGTTR